MTTVLVFVANEALRAQISTFLADVGFVVLEAADHARARLMEATHHGSIDVLMTDAAPDDVAQLIRRAKRNGRFMTALAISDHPEAVLREAASDPTIAFIEKPFAWRELSYKILESCIKSAHLRHRQLLCLSAHAIDECTRVCAQSAALLARLRRTRRDCRVEDGRRRVA